MVIDKARLQRVVDFLSDMYKNKKFDSEADAYVNIMNLYDYTKESIDYSTISGLLSFISNKMHVSALDSLNNITNERITLCICANKATLISENTIELVRYSTDMAIYVKGIYNSIIKDCNIEDFSTEEKLNIARAIVAQLSAIISRDYIQVKDMKLNW